MTSRLRSTRRAVLIGFAGALAAPALALSPLRPGRVRGLLGPPDGEGWLAGVLVELAPGWKTYWRVPGDSGVAPRFDFSASRNLAGADVLYPAPERLPDGGGGEMLGYSGDVVFPLRLRPADPARPVELAVRLDYGLCERICVPTEADLRITVGRASPMPADAARLEGALARVPRLVPAGTAVAGWRHDRASGRIDFTARLEGGARHAVVERAAGEPLPLPRLTHGPVGALAASLTDSGLAPDAVLTVTVVGDLHAVEETRRLDG